MQQLRLFHTSRVLQHENPLGLPRTGTIPRMQRGLPQKRPIKGVAKVIAVSSAKGGVGKSTVAANLALAFARLGYRSGILDMDVFGPSIPTLFNLDEAPRLTAHNQLVPLTNYGVQTMSIGYLVGSSSALVWRGPMLLKAVQQLLHEVEWGGGLDVLVLDLPPGTGDTQLSITQQVELAGAVVVTTPHALAVQDAVKGVDMFRKVAVPLLGLVQNMSVFRCPHCHGDTAVFGSSDRVQRACADHGLDFLGDIPLHPNIGEDASRGKPTVVAEPQSERAKVFIDIATTLASKIDLPSSST
ncbi:nucleotide binding protein-like protein [Lasiosphaeria miniovina]|uniref:Nucleotide binding protein-like protein n=1 Tax=Lasiosphaeria miniovina TaxID=1954250 RepID=A0AA40A5E9_9PEZI|nr:nucleotide binding protein-like protein [Lasiosphaeria miniovina]KAK0709515.1 nucleotide binding protein-like protein [Lasiosphaeria miniovina]